MKTTLQLTVEVEHDARKYPRKSLLDTLRYTQVKARQSNSSIKFTKIDPTITALGYDREDFAQAMADTAERITENEDDGMDYSLTAEQVEMAWQEFVIMSHPAIFDLLDDTFEDLLMTVRSADASAKFTHDQVSIGECKVCGHYGDDCTGRRKAVADV